MQWFNLYNLKDHKLGFYSFGLQDDLKQRSTLEGKTVASNWKLGSILNRKDQINNTDNP
jgi:hypothetical protein